MANSFDVMTARAGAAALSGSVAYVGPTKAAWSEGFVAGASWEFQALQKPDMDAAVLQMSVALRVFAAVPTNTQAIAAMAAYDAAVKKYQ